MSTILHIEDEDASAFLLQRALAPTVSPNRIFRVSDGENALAFLWKTGVFQGVESPSLAILDLHLPRLDGWAVLRTMKGQTDLRSIPVVIMSGCESDADRRRAIDMGAEQYVAKQKTIAATRAALLESCSRFFVPPPTAAVDALTFTLKAPTVVFERKFDLGMEANSTVELPAGAQLQILSRDPQSSIAHVRYQSRDYWIAIADLAGETTGDITRPGTPTCQRP